MFSKHQTHCNKIVFNFKLWVHLTQAKHDVYLALKRKALETSIN